MFVCVHAVSLEKTWRKKIMPYFHIFFVNDWYIWLLNYDSGDKLSWQAHTDNAIMCIATYIYCLRKLKSSNFCKYFTLLYAAWLLFLFVELGTLHSRTGTNWTRSLKCRMSCWTGQNNRDNVWQDSDNSHPLQQEYDI